VRAEQRKRLLYHIVRPQPHTPRRFRELRPVWHAEVIKELEDEDERDADQEPHTASRLHGV
jgi:hypothetical protein